MTQEQVIIGMDLHKSSNTIQGSNGMGRSIAQRLVAFDETVIDVPAKLATRVRVHSTGHGNKTDAADAMAIARAAIHSPHLRRVLPDDAAVAMKLISDRRKELVGPTPRINLETPPLRGALPRHRWQGAARQRS